MNDKNGMFFSSQQLTALGSFAKDGNLTADTFPTLSILFPSCKVSVQKLITSGHWTDSHFIQIVKEW